MCGFAEGIGRSSPNPRRVVHAPNPLGFYCEVYHLTKDEFGQTRYRVTTAVKSRSNPTPSLRCR